MNPQDLKIESLDTTPKGGQHVGIISCGVKLTHIPTGIVVICSAHRSQKSNKDIALSMLEWGLVELGWKEKPTPPAAHSPAPLHHSESPKP